MEGNNGNIQIEKELAKQHMKHLDNLVLRFCKLLNRKPQPTRDEIRKRFIESEWDWKLYCIKNKLGIRASMIFNAKVAYIWEAKYVLKKQNKK